MKAARISRASRSRKQSAELALTWARGSSGHERETRGHVNHKAFATRGFRSPAEREVATDDEPRGERKPRCTNRSGALRATYGNVVGAR